MGDDETDQVLAIARINTAIVQHLIGSLLMFPSAFGIGYMLPAGVASTMARHANLSEFGFELQDILVRLYQISFAGERGRKLNPLNLMLVLLVHHTAAFCLVIPMNIYYPNNSYFHEGVCLIQFGGFLLLFFQQYGYTLDVNTKDGLTKMKICCTIAFVTVIWTRVLRYGWLLRTILLMVWEDQNWVILKCMIVPTTFLSLFNLALLKDVTEKLIKFVLVDITKTSTAYFHDTFKLVEGIKELTKHSFNGQIRFRNSYNQVRNEDVYTNN